MQSSVAVLLSVYHKVDARQFRLAVESILRQSYSPWHLFIGVDGGVPDDLDALLSIFERNENITVIRFIQGRGLPAVLNDLIDAADGYEYIARMDADDISMNDRIEKQMRFIDNHPEVDVVGGAIQEIDEDGKVVRPIVSYPLSSEECHRFFSKYNPIVHAAALFRRRFFEKAGKYDETYLRHQDTMLWYEGFAHGCVFANLPDVIYKIRISDDLFRHRLGGLSIARQTLTMRKKINLSLNFGVYATIFAHWIFLVSIGPCWLRKAAMKWR